MKFHEEKMSDKSPCSSSFCAGKMVRDISLPRYMKPIPLEALFVPSYTKSDFRTPRICTFLHAYTWALTGTHIYGFLATRIDVHLILHIYAY